jgi:hypothetical protein
VYPQERDGTVILVSIVAQEFDPDVLCVYLRMLNEKRLDVPGISGLERAQVDPLVRLDRVPVAHTDPEFPDHAGEELEIGQHDCVDEDVVAQLDNDELVLLVTLE